MITFETPVTRAQFYAALYLLGDGKIKVYDTNDNLLASRKNIARRIDAKFVNGEGSVISEYELRFYMIT